MRCKIARAACASMQSWTFLQVTWPDALRTLQSHFGPDTDGFWYTKPDWRRCDVGGANAHTLFAECVRQLDDQVSSHTNDIGRKATLRGKDPSLAHVLYCGFQKGSGTQCGTLNADKLHEVLLRPAF